ncbi:unnamed protein product [Phaedon cochleariae]|uniref:Uncharacterized protein n=1 Tax=Phaedon cochleariae TaxID=80249 RepID=A0A9N9SDN8_PHACE|nr:unnamed protein product [Phaedon cochleariae]
MAVGMFIFSHKQRRKLFIIFLVLNIIQILIGCGMTSSSLYIIIAVSPILHTDRAEVNFAFVVTGLYGTHVIFHWIVGINICNKCFKQAHKKSTSNLFLLWSCLGTNTVLNLLIVSHFSRKINKHIARSIKQSISMGMSNYLQESMWKETIDKLQYSSHCCGIDSYEDWHKIKWLSKYHVDVKSTAVKEFHTDDDLTLPVTPWSCCKVDFPMQCLHDPLQQVHYAHMWVDEPKIVLDSINTKGCMMSLRKPIDAMINLFVLLTSLICILHVIIFIISRMLYTSTRNAILLEDPQGLAPGWIFGKGDCGYSGGKTLIEIMASPRKKVVEEIQVKTKKDSKSGQTSAPNKTVSILEEKQTNHSVNPTRNSTLLREAQKDEKSMEKSEMMDNSLPVTMEEELRKLQQ